MRECTNSAMKDRLPDLLHGRADASVRSHVAECESCARDLVLLEQIRAAARTPVLDVERLAAGIPGYRRSAWSRVTGSAMLRVAATIVLVVGGMTLVRRLPGTGPADTVVVRVASSETARGATTSPGAALRETTGAASAARAGAAPELAVGDPLTDLSDSDLRTLLEEMREIQPVPSAEPDVVVLPAVGRGSE